MTTVRGVMTIQWAVTLPTGRDGLGLDDDDPAVEAAISFIPQSGHVYLWGQDQEPAEVFLECSDRDVDVEEDDRLDQIGTDRPGSPALNLDNIDSDPGPPMRGLAAETVSVKMTKEGGKP